MTGAPEYLAATPEVRSAAERAPTTPRNRSHAVATGCAPLVLRRYAPADGIVPPWLVGETPDVRADRHEGGRNMTVTVVARWTTPDIGAATETTRHSRSFWR